MEKKPLYWEYERNDGFCPLPVEDGTIHLTRTGILRFTKLSDMAECTHMGRKGYWIRIRTAEGGPFRRCACFYLNGAAVTARKGGRDKNLPPMSALRLMKTIGFVTDVKNPDVLYGGTDAENEEEAAGRLGARIRHRLQAVTPGDMEDLVRETSLNIEKVKCFSGFDCRGVKKTGYVTLVVLQKDYGSGRNYFYRLKDELLKALKASVSPCLLEGERLSVTAPWFALMDVNVIAVTKDYGGIIDLQSRIGRAIEEYLNPVTGGYDSRGWDFGSIPGHSQLKHMIQRIEEVSYIRRLSISIRLEAMGELWEVAYEEAAQLLWTLPVSGNHEVTVVCQ